MKYWFFIGVLLVSFCASAQQEEERVLERDSTDIEYFYLTSDSTVVSSIEIAEVRILGKLKFENRDERRQYLILRRKTRKVWPYARLAAERLQTLNQRMSEIEDRSARKRYAKLIQKYIEDEFSEQLKKLTRTEGQILVKLIYRQTGITTFNLIKQLRSGWNAWWWQQTASLFDISLRETYDPASSYEDFLIEDILTRSFYNEVLDPQDAAFEIDFFAISDKWKEIE